MRRNEAESTDGFASRVAARASFLKMTPRKWRLVLAFGRVVRMPFPVFPQRPPVLSIDRALNSESNEIAMVGECLS